MSTHRCPRDSGWCDGLICAEFIDRPRCPNSETAIAIAVRRSLGSNSRMNDRYVGCFDDEDLYDYEVDRWKPGRFTMTCQHCYRRLSPLLSRSLVRLDAGWRWRGINHQEPFIEYFFACGWCGAPMLFTMYTPQ